MKPLISILILFGLNYRILSAQNSVKIHQQGNNNRATVTQSGSDVLKRPQRERPCNDFRDKMNHNINEILVEQIDSKNDTLLNSTGVQHNNVSSLLNPYKLEASQYGSGNGLYISTPDTQKVLRGFSTFQNGSQNQMSAWFNNSGQNITLSQKGTYNKIAINPCAGHHSRYSTQNDSVSIHQNGSGNTARINQH